MAMDTSKDVFKNISLLDTYSQSVTPNNNQPTSNSSSTTGIGNEKVFSGSSTTSTSTGASSSTTSTPTGAIPDFSSSAYGDLEFTKYLYESGLQNIFTDYQKNVQMLAQEEQQQLQQAYAIRELSKKYLGEYASNVGVGDVSGNLLDIYSQYANNIGDIQQNFSALEMNLSNEYTKERMDTFNNILATQYQIDMAQLDDAAVEISTYAFTEYDRDVQGGLAYIDAQQGTMRPQDYEAIRDSYYQANVQAALETINSGFYGFSDVDSRTTKTQEQYLNEVRQWMEPKDYERLKEQIALNELLANEGTEINFNEVSNIDANVYSDDPFVDSTSNVYEIETGQQYAMSTQPIEFDTNANIDEETLNARFEEEYQKDISNIKKGDIVSYKDVFYINSDGNWYRLINLSTSKMELDTFIWNKDLNEGGTTPPFGATVDYNYGDKGEDAITYNGTTYVEFIPEGANDNYKDQDEIGGIATQEIINHLNELYAPELGAGPGFGDIEPEGESTDKEVYSYVPKGTIFFFENTFWVYTEDGKKIRPMKRES